jgi:hypothetical protein
MCPVEVGGVRPVRCQCECLRSHKKDDCPRIFLKGPDRLWESKIHSASEAAYSSCMTRAPLVSNINIQMIYSTAVEKLDQGKD